MSTLSPYLAARTLWYGALAGLMGLSLVERAVSHGDYRAQPARTHRTLLGLLEDWEGLLLSSDDGPLSTLRKLTRTGRPAGDAAFVSKIEKTTGGDLSKGKPGRHRKRLA
jgi:hypothetical protein